MGYVPPEFMTGSPSVNAQLSRILATFTTASDFLGSSGARSPQPGLPRSYEEYRRQLYGEPGRDWFPTLNFAALTGGVALAVAVLVAIAT